MTASALVWNAENLDQWLADPEKLLPGQKMGLNVPDTVERANLIAYLAQMKAK
jgi:cytochrome c